MRNFLFILGVAAIAILMVGAIGIAFVFYKGASLDAESKAFVDSAVPAIAANWNKDQLLARGSPELRADAQPDKLDALFRSLSQLGPLVTYDGSKGEAKMSYSAGEGTVSATYVAKATFQHRTATFDIVLVKRDGHWMIYNFRVKAP